MKKYTVIKAFSILEKALLIPEDEIYAEEAMAERMRIFNPKTRKFIGFASVEKFKESTIESIDFKIYDNEKSKKEIIEYLDKMTKKSRSKDAIDNYNLIKVLVTENF